MKTPTKKDIDIMAQSMFDRQLRINREREREHAKADAVAMCNQILITLEDCNFTPPLLVDYWNGIKKKIESK